LAFGLLEAARSKGSSSSLGGGGYSKEEEGGGVFDGGVDNERAS